MEHPFWSQTPEAIARKIKSSTDGLSSREAGRRLRLRRQKEKEPPAWWKAATLFFRQFRNPLVMLLAVAVVLAAVLGDFTNSAIILSILLLTGILGFWQEFRAANAIESLRKLVKSSAWVHRDGDWKKVLQEDVVPGDRIRLTAGDLTPGDCLLLNSKDLYVNEAALTGESFPVEKEAAARSGKKNSEKSNAVFHGSHIISGVAEAWVVKTGADTELGKIAHGLQNNESPTAFELGISAFGYLLIRLTLLLAIGILVLNIVLGRPPVESVFFALALAIGMAPELLPAIMVTTLSSGALRMARQKVVVKKLSAIQNLGAIDVLCSDKTGTLTEGVVQVFDMPDAQGRTSDKVRLYAFLNASFESGFTNPIDQALRAMPGLSVAGYSKMDEIPYDFIRKRLSVLLQYEGAPIMITKGALPNILEICTSVEYDGASLPLETSIGEDIGKRAEQYGREGYRVMALAGKKVAAAEHFTRDEESGMTFLGFILLYDPPKAGIKSVIDKMEQVGVHLKIISGDSQYAVKHLAELIGLATSGILTGTQMDKIGDDALPTLASRTGLFAEIEPHQKERLIRALRTKGHIVGYLGDGINDAPALQAADVGISVDSGVDVAKEAADIVLMDKNFDVLLQGIEEGRRTYQNTLKYIFITTSANFGNMFSLAGVSLFLSYFPLLPKQILLLNFLSDIPALFIASDRVDDEMLQRPQKWNIGLIKRFMYVFGAQSSVFDYLTFGLLLLVFKVQASEFRTAWFIESVLTEVLILLIIRTSRRAWQSRPSPWLLWSGISVIVITLTLPYLPVAPWLGFEPLPLPLLAGIGFIALMYGGLSELLKSRFLEKSRTG